jgi:hypothetical protein
MAINGRVNSSIKTVVALLVIFAIAQVADAATITVNSLNDLTTQTAPALTPPAVIAQLAAAPTRSSSAQA